MPAIDAPFAKQSVIGFVASMAAPNMNFDQSSDVPLPDMTSVPSESVVTSLRDDSSVSVPGPVFSRAPAVVAAIVADTPSETATVPDVSVPPPAATVALARNVTDPAATAESTVAESPEFSKTAAVESYQLPATLFFDQLPSVRQLSPEEAPFHTYSPASASETFTFTFAPPSARISV